MKNEKNLRFRTDERTKERLKWGLMCQPDMKSYNAIIQRALETWFEENERIYGAPDIPKPRPILRTVSHKSKRA